ncbi:MAG: chromosome segregation protein SMC [Chloroflexi bacterium]|nr:chromosome segregation protein SMC [Chloroflexota bacterium]
MLLKGLELQGYKTFANRTQFLFAPGITAIVGPNGSGKSNVADAIRWVLGEQRQSNLRIKRTDDLIFAGSRDRARQGMAEVSITLDNSANWLPVDFAEVTITRRVYRSGESEYLLNGARLLARDIAEILGRGGLDREANIVIGQGLVDAVLSLRPAERRGLFEAAAGISLYQGKKEESLKRLDETQANLVRVSDILHEIAPRLPRLQRQAQRAEEHAILSQDLNGLLRLWYGRQWEQKSGELEDAQRRVAELVELVANQQIVLQAASERTQALVGQQGRLRQDLSAWHRESSALHSQLEDQTRHLAVAQERERLLQSQQREVLQELAALAPQRDAAATRVDELRLDLRRMHAEQEEAESELRQARERWERVRQERDRLAREARGAREALQQTNATIADCTTRLSGHADRRAELERELAELERQAKERQAALAQANAQLEALLRREQSLRDDLASVQERAAQAQARLQAARQRVEAVEAELRNVAQELVGIRNRQRMLQRMRGELSGYYAGVRVVMQSAERGELAGIVGPVVRLVRISPELDVAIDVALGAHLQDVVVERWNDAEAAIALLKRVREGRATFLPLDTLRSRPGPRPPAAAGVLGLASDLVQYEERYRVVLEMLLNRTLVVEDLPTARRLLREMASGLRLVTLEGDLVLDSGSVTGGSRRETDSKIALERDWAEIPQLLAAAEARQAQLEQRRKEAAQAAESISTELGAANAQVDSARAQLDAAAREISQAERQQQRLQDEIALHSRSLMRARAELDTLAERALKLERDRHAAEQGKVAQETRLAELEERLASFEETTAQRDIASAETTLAIARRNRQGQQALLDQAQGALRQAEDQVAGKEARAAELGREVQATGASIAQLADQTQGLRHLLDALRLKIEPAEAALNALERDREALEAEESVLRARHRELEAQSQQATLQRTLLNEELDRLQQRIGEELGPVDLPNRRARQLQLGIEEPSPTPQSNALTAAELENGIKELRAQLRRLGVINPNAPAEYAEEAQRHEFLASQAQDLRNAIQSLRDVIAELDKIMQEQFARTFAAIAAQFSKAFTTLFGGGQARLELTDPEDLTSTGVEVVARPPGKRLQNLSLLSGGERALTAAALLFAVLKTKPLPFCVLDEVDAMLDEANVGRFRDLLTEMSQQTQFIVITHNRHTVNAANTIYGITMRRDGVSAALSLKLDEAEQQIAESTAAPAPSPGPAP